MVWSRVSNKFSADFLCCSLSYSRRFSLLALIMHSQSNTAGEGRLCLHVTLPELFLRKKKKKKRSCYHSFSLQLLSLQKKSLERNPDSSKKSSCPCIFYNSLFSFQSHYSFVLFCRGYKQTRLLHWETTWSGNALFQVCVKYIIAYAVWFVSVFTDRIKKLNTFSWKPAVDLYCENFSDY